MPKLKRWELKLKTVRIRKGRRDPMDVAREQLEAKRRISREKILRRQEIKRRRRKKAVGIARKGVKVGVKEFRIALKGRKTRTVRRRRR